MVTLPIRVLEVVQQDGTRARSLRVFCPRELASVDPERCERCGFQREPEDGVRAPAIGCSAEVPLDVDETPPQSSPLLYGPHALATRVPIGLAAAPVVVCLLADTPLSAAYRGVPRGRYLSYPVVDADGVLVGSLPAGALPSDEGDVDLLLTAAEVMVPAVSVRECDLLEEAIGAMTGHHVRQIAIVDASHRVIGALTDLDLLRWVARGAPKGWW
jgi:CBS domain-containing protein